MRVLKLAIISVVFFFGLFTLISLLVPSRIRISKAINIGAPSTTIASLVTDTLRWKDWHPAFKISGKQEIQKASIITKLQSDSLIVMNLMSSSGKSITNGWQLYRYTRTDSITLQWYMDFHLKWYPWQKFGSLFYEATYGEMMQQGLAELKTIAEAEVSRPPE